MALTPQCRRCGWALSAGSPRRGPGGAARRGRPQRGGRRQGGGAGGGGGGGGGRGGRPRALPPFPRVRRGASRPALARPGGGGGGGARPPGGGRRGGLLPAPRRGVPPRVPR